MFCVVNIHFGVHLVSKLVKLLVVVSMASIQRTLAELTKANLKKSMSFGQNFIIGVFGFYRFFLQARFYSKTILRRTSLPKR